mmetsp:Transcript_64146/g.184246  ORF Transcript_64146/g.184246 Transcript_64146/m.184246 type:complete len:342 (-) Transcript_64146:83-1108(-)
MDKDGTMGCTVASKMLSLTVAASKSFFLALVPHSRSMATQASFARSRSWSSCRLVFAMLCSKVAICLDNDSSPALLFTSLAFTSSDSVIRRSDNDFTLVQYSLRLSSSLTWRSDFSIVSFIRSSSACTSAALARVYAKASTPSSLAATVVMSARRAFLEASRLCVRVSIRSSVRWKSCIAFAAAARVADAATSRSVSACVVTMMICDANLSPTAESSPRTICTSFSIEAQRSLVCWISSFLCSTAASKPSTRGLSSASSWRSDACAARLSASRAVKRSWDSLRRVAISETKSLDNLCCKVLTSPPLSFASKVMSDRKRFVTSVRPATSSYNFFRADSVPLM